MGSNCTKESSNEDLLNSNHVQFKLMQSMHNEPYDGIYDQVGQIGTGSTCQVMKVKAPIWRLRKALKESKDSNPHLNDFETSRHFAIKEISGFSAGMITEFENEIKLLKAIDHPRVVKIFQTFRLEKNRISAILMEMCQGGDLFSRPSYTEVETSVIVEQILSASAYLHDRNVVHRDLKHQNVLFVDNEHLDIKIIDFGLAKKYHKKTDRHYEKCGTMYTMSPEALNGNYTGSSTDLWSIGVITYMLLSNQKPFNGNDMNEVKKEILKKDVTFNEDEWKSISKEAQDFVSSLLHKTPAKRPTAKEALTHQFIKRHYRRDGLLKVDPELRLKIHDSIQQFVTYSVFKKVILQMIASRYPAKEILDLTHIFTDIDTTRRGTLSFAEFKGLFVERSYKGTELRSMFNLIALNRTGNILYTEFLACTLDAKGPIDQKRFLEVFEQIDRSNKGYIAKEDLRRILPRSITDKYLQSLLKGANVNGNVGLSFEMFLTFLTIDNHI